VTNWTNTTATPKVAQWVPLTPVELTVGEVDFAVKVNDAMPLYVYDANPLRVWPTPIESP